MNKGDKVTKALGLDYVDDKTIALTQQETLRRVVGILGMSLPILLYVSVRWYTHYEAPIKSISHYYFTRFGSIFVIIVSLLSIFLLVYKGKEPVDFYFSSTAGIASLLLLLLPASNLNIREHDASEFIVVTALRDYPLRDTIHDICGGIFLTSLAGMALFLFTKKDPEKYEVTPQKLARNVIYIICGIIMVFAIAAIPIAWRIDKEWCDAHQWTFWMESVALEAFGFSWLVKGEMILKDKKGSGR